MPAWEDVSWAFAKPQDCDVKTARLARFPLACLRRGEENVLPDGDLEFCFPVCGGWFGSLLAHTAVGPGNYGRRIYHSGVPPRPIPHSAVYTRCPKAVTNLPHTMLSYYNIG